VEKKMKLLKNVLVLAALAALVFACSADLGSDPGMEFAPGDESQNFSTKSGSFNMSGQNVKLEKASLFRSFYVPFHYVRGTILVENLGFNKSVGIVYTTNGWDTVNTSYGTYVGKAYNSDLDRFKVQTPVTGQDVEFALFYEVNGQTYWDNNGGSNYRVTIEDGVINPGEVQLIDASLVEADGVTEVQGQVAVKNLSPEKVVSLVYSEDGETWNTWSGIEYDSPLEDGYELWTFTKVVELTGSYPSLQFALKYEVNGETYWDNFHYYDYSLFFPSYYYVTVFF
jgi:hypothetical protein